jgi:Trm5-related predicted tRNA methylase
LELEQVLLELVVTQQRVLVIGGIVDDATKELCATSSGDSEHEQENERH